MVIRPEAELGQCPRPQQPATVNASIRCSSTHSAASRDQSTSFNHYLLPRDLRPRPSRKHPTRVHIRAATWRGQPSPTEVSLAAKGRTQRAKYRSRAIRSVASDYAAESTSSMRVNAEEEMGHSRAMAVMPAVSFRSWTSTHKGQHQVAIRSPTKPPSMPCCSLIFPRICKEHKREVSMRQTNAKRQQ